MFCSVFVSVFPTVELKRNLKMNNPFLKVIGNLYAKLPALQDLTHLGFVELRTPYFSAKLVMFQDKTLCVMNRISISALITFVTVCF